MSSPRLNNVIVVGCIMTYFSVILFGLDGGVITSEHYGKVCTVSGNCNSKARTSRYVFHRLLLRSFFKFPFQARAWIMSIGFTMAFGAMFAKTWRVHAIFKSITPKKKVTLLCIMKDSSMSLNDCAELHICKLLNYISITRTSGLMQILHFDWLRY